MIDLALARPAIGAQLPPKNLAAEIAEAPLRAMATLRGDLSSPEMASAVHAATGLAVPAQRRLEQAGPGLEDRRALWMSPDELLLQAPYGEAGRMIAEVEGALGGRAHLVVDVSDARTVFRLSGDGVRDLLAKGAPIDLHPDVFRAGEIRRTRIGAVAAAIYQLTEAPDVFELFCFRSYAPYLWEWLKTSAKPEAAPGVFAAGAKS